MNSNEHDTATHATYSECYVAYLDILGFKELVRRSQHDVAVLSTLERALETAVTLSPPVTEMREVHYADGQCDGISNERCWITQIRAFSDSVVLFIPTEIQSLVHLLRKVRYLHDRLLEMGCCMRGALTIGDMYWNDAWCRQEAEPRNKTEKNTTEVLYDRDDSVNSIVTFGPALVEAYELESKVALYPRIIFSPKLMAHLHSKSQQTPERSSNGIHRAARATFLCPSSADNHSRSIMNFVRTDSDAVAFFDVFHRDIFRDDTQKIVREKAPDGTDCIRLIRDGITYESFMRQARGTIENLLKSDCEVKVMVKYLWLANYFNESLRQLNIEPLAVDWQEKTVNHQ